MITVNHKELLAAVKTASLAVDRKSTMPILACLELKATGGILSVRGTDLTNEIVVTLPCEGEFHQAIDAKALLTTVAAVGGKSKKSSPAINLTETPGQVEVRGSCGAVSLTVSLSPKDFPRCYSVVGDNILYGTKQFKSALDFVLPAVSTDTTRYHLNGVCLALRE